MLARTRIELEYLFSHLEYVAFDQPGGLDESMALDVRLSQHMLWGGVRGIKLWPNTISAACSGKLRRGERRGRRSPAFSFVVFFFFFGFCSLGFGCKGENQNKEEGLEKFALANQEKLFTIGALDRPSATG